MQVCRPLSTRISDFIIFYTISTAEKRRAIIAAVAEEARGIHRDSYRIHHPLISLDLDLPGFAWTPSRSPRADGSRAARAAEASCTHGVRESSVIWIKTVAKAAVICCENICPARLLRDFAADVAAELACEAEGLRVSAPEAVEGAVVGECAPTTHDGVRVDRTTCIPVLFLSSRNRRGE